MEHKKLVEAAKRWLIFSKGCNPVFCEKGSANISEKPDAIGWTAEDCIVAECKTSMEDFKRNSKKTLTLGTKKYFVVAGDLFEKIKDMDLNGWGLVVVSENDDQVFARQARLKESCQHTSNLKDEIFYLRSRILEIQRYGQ